MVKKRTSIPATPGMGKIGPKEAEEIERIRREWNEAQIEREYALKATTLPENWKTISENIKQGDGGKCVICENKRGFAKLTVHHRDSDESNNKKSNLMTICEACHEKFPEPPFAERFYCKTIVHDYPSNVICMRFGRAFGSVPDVKKCPFHDDRHGCLAIAIGLAKDARDVNKA